MKAKFIEKYNKLSDMRVGDIAISKDRKNMFACCWAPNKDKTDCYMAIISLNNLLNQYTHKLNLNQPVKILQPGDQFVLER